MKINLLVVEKCFVVSAFIMFTGGVVQLIYEIRTGQYSGGLDTEGNIDVMVALFSIYIITFFLVILRWKQFVYALTKTKLLLFLVGIAVVSALWSVSPELTIRRSVALAASTMFGVYFGTRYTLNEQFRLLLWTFGVAMLLSVLFALLLPSFGIHRSGGAAGLWRGIYTHKNTLGRNMGYSLFIFTLVGIWGDRHRWIGWAGSGLAVALILLSGSVTPVFSTLTVFVVLPLYSILRWRYNSTTLFFTTVAMAYIVLSALLLSLAPTLLGFFGRDLSFTGRTVLWSALLEAIPKRLWLGYGYSAFWLEQNNEALEVFRNLRGWQPDYAHNGYLEITLSLGLLGLVVYLSDFFIKFFQTLILAAATKTAAGMFPLAFMTYMIPCNISDSIILSQNSIVWVVYVSVTLSLVLNPIQVKILKRA